MIELTDKVLDHLEDVGLLERRFERDASWWGSPPARKAHAREVLRELRAYCSRYLQGAFERAIEVENVTDQLVRLKAANPDLMWDDDREEFVQA